MHEELLANRDVLPADREQWRATISSIYRKMKMKSRNGPYDIRCDGIALTVLPNVYAPRFFTDSLWFARQLPPIIGRKSLLEVGTGTGLIAIACALNGARVVATDLNPDAVINARLNIAKYNFGIHVMEGNLFEPIGPNENFDYIFWAHPFNNWETPVSDMLLRSGLDYHYEGLRGYIAEARNHLTPDGKVLLGTGDSADHETIFSIAAECGLQMRLLDQAQLPLEEGGRPLIRYLIYEFVGA